MSIDVLEKREQTRKLRAKVLQAEQERLNGEKTFSISKARSMIKGRADEVKIGNYV